MIKNIATVHGAWLCKHERGEFRKTQGLAPFWLFKKAACTCFFAILLAACACGPRKNFTSPEKTLKTYMSALHRGDAQTMLECFANEAAAAKKAAMQQPADSAAYPQEMKYLNKVKGVSYKITSKNVVITKSTTTADVVMSVTGPGVPESFKNLQLRLEIVEHSWKIMFLVIPQG